MDQPRNALTERHSQDFRYRQTGSLDDARRVAGYGYLPLHTRLSEVQDHVSRVPIVARRRLEDRPIQQDLAPEATRFTQPQHLLCHLQRVAWPTSAPERTASGPGGGDDSESD